VSSVSVGNVDLSVWTADDPTERRQGLRGIEDLPDGIDGMAFIYESPVAASYVMRDTVIPLDIWWFDEDGVLVATDEMTPCSAEPCADYRSPGPILSVLETPAGEFEFEVGSRISTVESG
jgi:uncharacterized membrane protein (UPF0127 family)